MCDYSLHGIPNRLAKEGEVLVVHRFHTGSKGLTSPEYLKPTAQPKGLIAMLKSFFAFPGQSKACAVCVPDGAKLILYGISTKLQEAHGLGSTETVTFRQLSAEAQTYRDAVEFRNGVRVRLQEQGLEDGQRVEVLTLSSEKDDVEVALMTDAFGSARL
jgi:hypothetical protein